MLSSQLLVRVEDGYSFQETLDPSFLDLTGDNEIAPCSNVFVSGQVDLADGWVILQSKIETSLLVSCATCAETFPMSIQIQSWKHQVNERENRNGWIDVTQMLRDEILLEVPLFIVCGGSACTNRESIGQYLVTREKEEKNQPFLSLL